MKSCSPLLWSLFLLLPFAFSSFIRRLPSKRTCRLSVAVLSLAPSLSQLSRDLCSARSVLDQQRTTAREYDNKHTEAADANTPYASRLIQSNILLTYSPLSRTFKSKVPEFNRTQKTTRPSVELMVLPTHLLQLHHFATLKFHASFTCLRIT